MKGSIRKVDRKHGHKWRVEVPLPTGPDEERKRKTKVFDKKGDAERWKAKINQQINEGGGFIDPSNDPLKTYLDYWLENYADPNLADSTYQVYENHIEKHIKPRLGDIRLKDLSPTHLQQFYTHKLKNGRLDGQDGGLSKATVAKMHRILHKAFDNALQWQMIKRNPAEAVDAPTPDHSEKETLDGEQSLKFLEMADDESRYGPIFHVALYLGLRRSEILGLRWKDIDFKNDKISINQTLVRTTNGDLVLGEPKSKSSRRTLLAPKQLMVKLKNHKTEQQKLRMRVGQGWEGDNHDLVFTTTNGTMVKPSNLTNHYKSILNKADLPDISFHSLRHSTATLLLERGVNPKVVQSILGHASTKITLDTYSHVSDDLQEEAAQGLADALTSNPDSKLDAG